MPQALYIPQPNAAPSVCPAHAALHQRWQEGLPLGLQGLVVPPVCLDVFREYEMQAERIQGRDAANTPCYCEFRYVLTELRSDDDEVFYEAPVYAETLTSWRMLDERWLVCRTTLNRNEACGAQTSLTISDCMPR